MAKDHFIPASLIARFSEDVSGSSRQRKVWTIRKNGEIHEARAETIGYSNELYDVDDLMFPTRGLRAVDDIWNAYESQLSSALDRLIAGSATAIDWIDTLVPFVAASFARDRGYKHRVTGRIERDRQKVVPDWGPVIAGLILDDTNIALNRVFEMDRHAARVLACEWTVEEVDGDIVLPDVGYGFDLIGDDPEVVAFLLPIGPRHLIYLVPQATHKLLTRRGDNWVPSINYDRCQTSAEVLNVELAKTAQDFVVGAHPAIERLGISDLGIFDWSSIDQILEFWPFDVDTRELSGLHRVVRSIVHEEGIMLNEVILQRYQTIADIEPQATLLFPRRDIRADRFLELDSHQLIMTVK